MYPQTNTHKYLSRIERHAAFYMPPITFTTPSHSQAFDFYLRVSENSCDAVDADWGVARGVSQLAVQCWMLSVGWRCSEPPSDVYVFVVVVMNTCARVGCSITLNEQCGMRWRKISTMKKYWKTAVQCYTTTNRRTNQHWAGAIIESLMSSMMLAVQHSGIVLLWVILLLSLCWAVRSAVFVYSIQSMQGIICLLDIQKWIFRVRFHRLNENRANFNFLNKLLFS